MAMKLLGHFASDQIQLVAGKQLPQVASIEGCSNKSIALTTGWDPLAGAPSNIIEEVKQTLRDDYDSNAPQSALEVGTFPYKIP